LKANFETGFSLHRYKGWNQALSSYGSTEFNVYSPTVDDADGVGYQAVKIRDKHAVAHA
jgi:hypothetical protein